MLNLLAEVFLLWIFIDVHACINTDWGYKLLFCNHTAIFDYKIWLLVKIQRQVQSYRGWGAHAPPTIPSDPHSQVPPQKSCLMWNKIDKGKLVPPPPPPCNPHWKNPNYATVQRQLYVYNFLPAVDFFFLHASGTWVCFYSSVSPCFLQPSHKVNLPNCSTKF